MEQIYLAIMAQLKQEAPELKWIDLDEGQLEYYTERPALSFPCVLIDIALTECRDLYPGAQLCNATVGIRIAQNIATSRTNSVATETTRKTAIERYQLVEKIHKSLSGSYFKPSCFNPLSRTSQQKEKRDDGLFVIRIDFQTQFKETLNS